MTVPESIDRKHYEIPEGAEEKVLFGDGEGRKGCSEFYLEGVRVARVEWNDNGTPSYVEPFAGELQHGTVRQFDDQGKILSEAEFDRGNGWDLWADNISGELSESRQMKQGSLDGLEQWWHEGETRVYIERHYREGLPHGIDREWDLDERDRLKSGYPKYFIRGKEVTQDAYAAAYASDPTLPTYHPDDDRSEREPPEAWRTWKTRR